MLSRFPFPLDIALLLPCPFFFRFFALLVSATSFSLRFSFFYFCSRRSPASSRSIFLLSCVFSSLSLAVSCSFLRIPPHANSLSLSPLSFLSSALTLLFLSKFPPSPLIPVASLYLYYLSLDLRLRSLSIPCLLFHCISPEFLFSLFSLSLFRPLPSRLVLTFPSHFSAILSLTTDVSFSLSPSFFFPFPLSSDSSLNFLFRFVFQSSFSLSFSRSHSSTIFSFSLNFLILLSSAGAFPL